MDQLENISVSFIIPFRSLPRVLLERCLDSVITLGAGFDWEAWVIDDGTPDSQAASWVAAYADARIHYHYQEWAGLGAARNQGILLAGKSYILFLDSDDFLFTEPMLAALSLLDRIQPDVLSFRHVLVWDSKPLPVTGRLSAPMSYVDYDGSGSSYMAANNVRVSACSYLIRRVCLGNLRFSTSLYHEDEEFTPLMLLQAKRLLVTHLPVYGYYQRAGSIMNDADPVKLQKRFDDMLLILRRHTDILCRLQHCDARALNRRNALFALAVLYESVRQSPSRDFLYGILSALKRMGYYPLPRRNEPVVYRIARLATWNPVQVLLMNRCFRFFRKITGK